MRPAYSRENRPSPVGKSASHACIRLKNSDVDDPCARLDLVKRLSVLAERTTEVARRFGGEPFPANSATVQSQKARKESCNPEGNARSAECCAWPGGSKGEHKWKR